MILHTVSYDILLLYNPIYDRGKWGNNGQRGTTIVTKLTDLEL